MEQGKNVFRYKCIVCAVTIFNALIYRWQKLFDGYFTRPRPHPILNYETLQCYITFYYLASYRADWIYIHLDALTV